MFIHKKKFEELQRDVRDLELETIESLLMLEEAIRDIKSNLRLRGIWK